MSGNNEEPESTEEGADAETPSQEDNANDFAAGRSESTETTEDTEGDKPDEETTTDEVETPTPEAETEVDELAATQTKINKAKAELKTWQGRVAKAKTEAEPAPVVETPVVDPPADKAVEEEDGLTTLVPDAKETISRQVQGHQDAFELKQLRREAVQIGAEIPQNATPDQAQQIVDGQHHHLATEKASPGYVDKFYSDDFSTWKEGLDDIAKAGVETISTGGSPKQIAEMMNRFDARNGTAPKTPTTTRRQSSQPARRSPAGVPDQNDFSAGFNDSVSGK